MVSQPDNHHLRSTPQADGRGLEVRTHPGRILVSSLQTNLAKYNGENNIHSDLGRVHGQLLMLLAKSDVSLAVKR